MDAHVWEACTCKVYGRAPGMHALRRALALEAHAPQCVLLGAQVHASVCASGALISAGCFIFLVPTLALMLLFQLVVSFF